MAPFALSGLLSLITNLGLGIFVLKRTPNNRTNRLWVYFSFAVAWWELGALIIGQTRDPKLSLLWWNIAHLGVTLIAIFFIQFIHAFLEIQNNRIVVISYMAGFFFMATILCGQFIKKVFWFRNSFYFDGNPSTALFLCYSILWIISIIYCFYLLHKAKYKASTHKRNQIKYFFLATSIGFGGGFTCFLPTLGLNIYPYGNFLVAIYPFIMAYAILKYNLMDITIVIRRSLIYSLLVTAITLVFLVSVLISEHIFNRFLHYQHITTSMIAAILIAIIYTPLKNKIQDLTDRAFFRATPLEMAQQNELLRQEIVQTEKFKAIAALASGMAHEIKNPLTPIKTFSEALPARLNDKEFLLKFSRIIGKEVARIDGLVQELLRFSRPSPPQLKETNITQLIEQTLELLNNQILSRQIHLETSFQNQNLLINIDPQQIKQALLNIFLNAIDAMPNGGTLSIITNVIPAPAPPLLLREQKLAGKAGIQIEISDTGCGIDTKDLPHIFEPFFTKKQKGTGLGLAITHGIIEKHGGMVTVESKLNQGTVFKIKLK